MQVVCLKGNLQLLQIEYYIVIKGLGVIASFDTTYVYDDLFTSSISLSLLTRPFSPFPPQKYFKNPILLDVRDYPYSIP
jgi:hypothetical protein